MKSILFGVSVVAAAAVLGVACGSDGATTGTTAITVPASNYQTLPPAVSTIPPQTTAPDAPGAVTQFETDYVIAAGDLPATIANDWNISLQALLDANGWTLEGQYVPAFPPPGTTIKIPAGATVPGIPAPGTVTATTVAGGDTAATTVTTSAPTTTAVPVDSCGTYTITADDTSRIGVANKFDTTVEKLDAANAGTKGYSGFYPGLIIKLPC
jgi:LysM repeat protein